MRLGHIPLTRPDGVDEELLEEMVEAVACVGCESPEAARREVERFEREIALCLGVSAAVGVASGVDALALTLRALAVGPGDSVLVRASAHPAAGEAVCRSGASLRIVDVGPAGEAPERRALDAALRGPRPVKAAILDHRHGAPVDAEPIVEQAARAGIPVVEDVTDALGARVRGRIAGTLGIAAVASLDTTAPIGAWGDAGVVITRDRRLAAVVRELRTWSAIDAVQAAVLRRKLLRLDPWVRERRRLGSALAAILAGAGVAALDLPRCADHAYGAFVVGCDRRDALRAYLARQGIASEAPPVLAPELPAAGAFAARACRLPLWCGMRESDLRAVADAVREFMAWRSGADSDGPGLRLVVNR